MKSKKLKLFLGSLFTIMLLFNVFVGVQQNENGQFSGITLNYVGQMAFSQTEGGGDTPDCNPTVWSINQTEDCKGGFFRPKTITCVASMGNCCLKDRIGETC